MKHIAKNPSRLPRIIVPILAVFLIAGLTWVATEADVVATPEARLSEVAGGERPLSTVSSERPPAPAPAEIAESLVPADVAPLAPHTEKGLAYLANQQLPSGGWGQGGGWRNAGHGGRIDPAQAGYQDAADVANTAIATLALIRGGSAPASGPYADHVRAGLDFVLASIEAADHESLFVTDVRGSQLQSKIGVYVDTFLANLLLAEVRGRMPDPDAEARLETGLAKVLSKIERHQRDDGTFDGNQGWASVLSTSLANKALNRARQAGAPVADETLEKIRKQAREGFDEDRGEFAGGDSYGSSAGVKLYKDSAGLAALDDLGKTDLEEELKAREVLASEAPAARKIEMRRKLESLQQLKEEKQAALGTMAKRLSDASFVAGFGSSGGEEYLSYMNISEALAADGGEEWATWSRRVGDSLAEAQNGDGSWSGHHCITGRTFVTSAALLTLMADRAPRPLAAQVRG